MLIHKVLCPKCSAALNSKPGIQSGSQITCPRCKHVFAASSLKTEEDVVEVLEMVDDEESAPPARKTATAPTTRTKSGSRQRDSEDGEDHAERSTARKRPVETDDAEDEKPRRGKNRSEEDAENVKGMGRSAKRHRDQRGSDNEDRDHDRNPDQDSRRSRSTKGKAERKRPLALIIGAAALLLIGGGIAIYFVAFGKPMRGEREIKELIKAKEAADSETDPKKKLDASLKVLGYMMAIENLKLTEDEQKKLLAKYKPKLDELKLGVEEIWGHQNSFAAGKKDKGANFEKDMEEAVFGKEETAFAAKSGISRETLRAWRKKKLSAGWYGQKEDSRTYEFTNTPDKFEKLLPGFSVFAASTSLAGLPAPETPFLLNFAFTKMNDNDFKGVSAFKNLSVLMLGSTQISDQSMQEIADLTNLTQLILNDTRVTDAGLKHLANLKNLTILKLEHVKVSDAGMEHLANLKNLADLDLSETRVSAVGMTEIQKALPNCKVHRWDQPPSTPEPKKGTPDPKKGGSPDPDLNIIAARDSLKMDSPVRRVLIADDGGRMAVEQRPANVTKPGDSKVQVWDLNGKPAMRYEQAGMLRALSPDGKKLIVQRGSDGSDLVDLETKQIAVRIDDQLFQTFSYCTFLSNELIVSARPASTTGTKRPLAIRVFNASDGKQAFSFVAGDDDRVSISEPFNQRSQIAIAVENANVVKIWDVMKKQMVREFAVPDAGKALSKGRKWKPEMPASSDGKWLALGQPRIVELWNLEKGEKAQSLNMPFSSRGAWISTPATYVCAGNMTRPQGQQTGESIDMVAYDLSREKIVASFRGHTALINAFAVADNGKVMATGDRLGHVHIWDLAKIR